jgi:hypothetical protein
MNNVTGIVDNIIPRDIRKLVNSNIRFIFTYNPKSSITGDLHRDVLEQVRHQLMQPMQLNLILPNPEETWI